MEKTIKLFEITGKGLSKENSIDWSCFTDPKFGKTWSEILDENDPITFSLEKIKYIKLESLVWLAFIILYRSNNNRFTSIFLPDKLDNLMHFIKFSHFDELKRDFSFRFINEFLLPRKSKYIKDDNPYHESQKIVYVDKENIQWKYRKLSTNVREYLKEIFNVNPIDQKGMNTFLPFLKTIKEITSNMIVHGGNDGEQGKGIISLFPAMSTDECVTYCFSDIGDGFAMSLKRKQSDLEEELIFKDEYDAILTGLLYRYSHRERGIDGLYGTLAFIADQFGTLSIMSKNVLVKFDFSEKDNRRLFYEKYEKMPSKQWLEDISEKQIAPFNVPGVHFRITMKLDKKEGKEYANY